MNTNNINRFLDEMKSESIQKTKPIGYRLVFNITRDMTSTIHDIEYSVHDENGDKVYSFNLNDMHNPCPGRYTKNVVDIHQSQYVPIVGDDKYFSTAEKYKINMFTHKINIISKSGQSNLFTLRKSGNTTGSYLRNYTTQFTSTDARDDNAPIRFTYIEPEFFSYFYDTNQTIFETTFTIFKSKYIRCNDIAKDNTKDKLNDKEYNELRYIMERLAPLVKRFEKLDDSRRKRLLDRDSDNYRETKRLVETTLQNSRESLDQHRNSSYSDYDKDRYYSRR